MNYIDFALMSKALGDPTRLKIFDMLKNGKLCACTILEEFNITQPTLSYHMRILTDSGLVICDKDGKWCYYSLDCKVVNELTTFLSKKCINDSTKKCCDKE